ncbi:hypothetical protein ACFPRA_09540 [Sporosarcina soli]|uniref:Uncharacterized protein n=1 Tax=Sporosarcina soli TaxID=334736 RepID=A0ABW0TI52_9BACL
MIERVPWGVELFRYEVDVHYDFVVNHLFPIEKEITVPPYQGLTVISAIGPTALLAGGSCWA